jgi:hypothetical protein
MKNQTAVEWLVKELEEHHVFHDIKNTVAYQQAKAMETEQIIDAFDYGLYDGGENVPHYNMNAEKYYKETYEK